MLSRTASAVGAIMLASITGSSAQPVPESPPSLRSGTVIEEIVVTAQKREQRFVDVGLNVSTLSGEDMKEVHVEQIRDLAGYVPNVNIKEQVPGAMPIVTIRGVGLDDFSSTNSPAAGIYVDEVPLSSLAPMSFDLYDVDRLEVLKGPQGTLYGRNTTAGAINVVTARPKDHVEAAARVGIGSFDNYDLEGMVNPVLLDWLPMRVSGKRIAQAEGFWTSRLREDGSAGERDIGDRDLWLGRVQAAMRAFEGIDVNLKLDGIRQRSEMGQPEHSGTICRPGSQPIDPDACTDLTGYTDTDRDPFTGDWQGEFPYDVNQWSSTLIANADLGIAELTSVTGYLAFNRMFHIDVDGQPADQFNFVQRDRVKQATQELRLAGDTRFAYWLLGGFYSWDRAEVDTPGRHQDLIPGESSHILADQKTRSAAVFGSATWHLLDTLELVSGLRFTWEESDYVGGSTWAIPIPNLLNNTFNDESISDTNLSWKVGLEWKPLDDSILYANVSKGVKSGGFFSGITTDDAQLQPYAPESLIAYEGGGKAQLLDDSLLLNASAFYYDYSDLQTLRRAGTAPVQLIGNVSEAEVYGSDLEAFWKPLSGLTLQSGVGILRTKLGAFIGPTGENIPEGNELGNAPELTFRALARYEMPLPVWDLAGALQTDAQYVDSVFKEATNDPLIRARPYWLPNARLSLFDLGGRWEAALWGRNLSDTRYVVQGINVSIFGVISRMYNAPRTFGGEIVYRFQ